MKRIVQFLCLCLILTSAAHAETYSYKGSKPQAVIDVRTPEEFASGHVAGAVNIPVDQLSASPAFLKALKKDEPVLVYCRSGRRSAMAKLELDKQGFQKVIDGGALDSLSANLKVCKEGLC